MVDSSKENYFHIFFERGNKEDVIKALVPYQNADGGLKNAFENLPWWSPVFTLDGLIILKKEGLIDF